MALPSTLLFKALLSIGFTVFLVQLQLVDVSLAGVITCPNMSLETVGTFCVIPQATVDVVCGLSQSVIRSTTTNSAGIFSFFFNRARIQLLLNPKLCQLRIILPVGSCVFVPPGGSIRSSIIAIRVSLNIVSAYIPGPPTYVVT
ncbi:hypothetical protein Salat_1148000 [Sesamum alatum]|uniref:Pollen Ole e 1 allergen and extensin family protein n=1 Tax=Sesamum alatum TaxID=300844 RepID=A0AAE1YE10_9LAMI|nr:hypothetical protein Salat_1148000 [Sesamum alatum]